jgi:hypothetical protein
MARALRKAAQSLSIHFRAGQRQHFRKAVRVQAMALLMGETIQRVYNWAPSKA